MKNLFRPALLLIISVIALTSRSVAQDTISTAAGSRLFDDLHVFAPWTMTTNPAAVSTIYLGRISIAQAGYWSAKDEARLFLQPEESNSFHAETKGYMQLGRISLFGSFGYENNRYNGLIYNSTLMFNSLNPYVIGDTVPDTQSKEGFDLSGQASLKLSDRLSFAVGANYYAAVGAKQKDPRNKNNIATLEISPGVILDLGKLKLGFSGSLFTSSNEISFSVQGNWKRDLFILQGLGYYKDEPEITSYSELYDGNGYSAGIQASWESGSLVNVAEVAYKYSKEEARSGSSYRLIDGVATTNTLLFSDMLRISRSGAFHIMTLDGSLSGLSGDEVLQRMYTVRKPNYSYDSLATVSWISNKHLISDVFVNAGYCYASLNGPGDIKSEIGGNITFRYYTSGHYPLQTYGEMTTTNLALSAFINRVYTSGKTRITPGAEVSYRTNIGSSLSFREQEQSIPEMVYNDYDVLKADLINAKVAVRIEKFLTARAVRSLFFVPRFDYTLAMGETTETMTGYFIDATLGLTF